MKIQNHINLCYINLQGCRRRTSNVRCVECGSLERLLCSLTSSTTQGLKELTSVHIVRRPTPVMVRFATTAKPAIQMNSTTLQLPALKRKCLILGKHCLAQRFTTVSSVGRDFGPLEHSLNTSKISVAQKSEKTLTLLNSLPLSMATPIPLVRGPPVPFVVRGSVIEGF